MPDPDRDPTGRELIDHYLAPLAAHPAIAPHLRCDARVVSVTRRGMDRVPSTGTEERPFEIVTVGSDGSETRHLARADHRRVGHVGATEPGRRQRRPRARRTCRGGPDQLRHPRRVRHAAGTLRRSPGDGDRLRAFGDGLDPRPDPPPARGTDDGDPVGDAFDAERANLRRSRPTISWRVAARSASGPRPPSTAAQSNSSHRSASTPSRSSDGVVAVTGETDRGDDTIDVDEVIVATGFRPDFTATVRAPTRPPSVARIAASARPADRPQRTQLRHRATPRRARAASIPNRASTSSA